jgi:nitroreductase
MSRLKMKFRQYAAPIYRAMRPFWRRMMFRRNVRYDALRYRRSSAAFHREFRSPEDVPHLRALITMDYHRIEKGLALRQPRSAFGQEVIRELARNTAAFARLGGSPELLRIVRNVLLAYIDYHDRQKLDLGGFRGEVTKLIQALNATDNSCQGGGTRNITREEWFGFDRSHLPDFFLSRSSVRDFTHEPVDDDVVERIVHPAMKPPSVCNRQAWRLYDIPKSELMMNVLSCQNGNAGFRDSIPRTFIVACDLRQFVSVGERNQGWIDGGMFAMSLLWAIHAEGLGACALNWSVEQEADQKLRRFAPIPDHEIVLMMIAFGHVPEAFRVAQSPRKPVSEIWTRLVDDIEVAGKARVCRISPDGPDSKADGDCEGALPREIVLATRNSATFTGSGKPST